MYHIPSSETERGWTAEVEPLWEDVARDGKGDLHRGHAAHVTTDILDAHASVFLVKNEQQQVVKKVSSYFRCRGKKKQYVPAVILLCCQMYGVSGYDSCSSHGGCDE